MSTYIAPTRDMRFVIEDLAGLERITALPGCGEVGPELVEAVLEEAAKLAAEVLAPLNKSGDQEGAKLTEAGVVAAAGFRAAYRAFVDGGWNGLACAGEFDGQGLPELLGTAAHEMWNSANMAFALCPMLTQGAIEAIAHHGSDTQQAAYLPKMVSGEWTGTMNLTEPQAGSDLSAVRTRALAQPDGSYRLHGQKIFITWGDHDLADNTVHLVLARTPDAPEGVKGISLFIVPKFLLNADGSLGARNDVRCVSIEHKMGIHASPTCVLAFGDQDGAVGYLVGEENKGLGYMFTMMNEARLKVGLQGVAIGERAYQQALGYARDRIQGRPAGARSGDRVAIIHHPDVRRMLLSMKSQVEAMRALAYAAAAAMDVAKRAPDAGERQAAQAHVDLLIPIVKGWCTELGQELTSLGVQVHGGMGFIEETGACQHLRDARITTIYEGTTGIQAADLVGRKLAADGGAAMTALIGEIRATVAELEGAPGDDLAVIGEELSEAAAALERAARWVVEHYGDDLDAVLAQSANVLMLAGYVCGGWQMARAALVANRKLMAGQEPVFFEAKLLTARFYAEQVLPKAGALAKAILRGGRSTLALAPEQF